jgi:hypothetical protein
LQALCQLYINYITICKYVTYFLLAFKQTLKTSKKVVLLPSFFILTVAILLLSVVILPTQAQNQGGNFTTI